MGFADRTPGFLFRHGEIEGENLRVGEWGGTPHERGMCIFTGAAAGRAVPQQGSGDGSGGTTAQTRENGGEKESPPALRH
ncbi:hypothetical protein GCM10018793_24380 [Streptomyces sulfonofaciens]|uniref:Uncharacterized protein n=1 Tax=Streptomyces sulfonofaciens TaxID=68272 RepID=A0A919G3N4_9ACTN|nr:hypothetical protein [Streptomyces sulfonofaciens]GHH77114.1 hypothetical protein GCM10018793_24380 [Streptomyces sulfonofaciens]